MVLRRWYPGLVGEQLGDSWGAVCFLAVGALAISCGLRFGMKFVFEVSGLREWACTVRRFGCTCTHTYIYIMCIYIYM